MANPILEAFQWGAGGAKLTPEQVARQREIAAALMQKGDPAFHNAGWLGAIGRGLEGAYSGWSEGRANRAETEGRADFNSRLSSILGGGALAAPEFGGSPATSTSMATAPAPDYASARVAQAHGDSTAPAVNLSESKQAFISNLLPAAIEESKRTGVDPRIIVAQAAQETGWGRSAPGNNYFGIKSHGKSGGQSFKTHEYVNGKRVNITDSFRRFDSPADSVRGYGDFILQNPRYRPLREAQGIDAQLEALQASGYATDPNYSRSVGAIARGIALPDAIAANEAMASGELANPSLTPDAVQQWAAQNYAPEQAAGVTVAETPEEILAAEAAMAVSPGAQPRLPQAAPQLPEPTMVQDLPVAEIAQSLTNANVNPDIPLAGGTSGFAPIGTQAPNVSLPDGASFSLPDPSMAVAQSLAAQSQQQGGMPNMQQLIELASDPWATDAQRGVVQALLQQQMQAQDPYNQAQLEKLRLETEALRNPTQKPIEVGGVLLDPGTMQPIFDSRDNTPSNVREYEYYANAETAAGRQPMPFGDWDQSRRRSGATQISVGGEGAPGLGKLSTDYGYIVDPETRQPVIDPATGLPKSASIPGSPAWQAQRDAERQRELARTNAANYARTVTQDIGIADEYLGQIEGMAAEDGVIGANLRNTRASIAGTPENNMKSFVDSALSNVTLDTMNRMRESSPAGATGFGNMSERQMEVIRGVLGNWKPSIPVEDQRMILHRLGNFYLDVQFGSEQERQEAVRDGRMSPVENDAIQELYYPETRDIRGRRINEGGNRTSSGVQWSIE